MRYRSQYARAHKMLPFRSLTVLLAIICTFVLFSFIWSFSNSDRATNKIGEQLTSKYWSLTYGVTPYSASWKTWYFPGAWTESRHGAQNGGKIDEYWNLYEHLGGYSPWIPKRNGIITNSTAPPDDCVVQQVHMLSRHGERYPTDGAAKGMTDMLEKIRSSTNSKHEDEFAFLNHWTMFLTDPESQIGQLTLDGPFAGHLEAFTTGVKFRTRYNHLLPKTGDPKTRIFTASGKRVIETAQYFAQGFFGINANESSEVVVIPEDDTQGGNTLAPADSCVAYRNDDKYGHEYGTAMMKKYRAIYTKPVAARIKKQLMSSGRHVKLELTDEDIYAMQEICGFETIARGKSPWCDVFSTQEWESFEYARDLVHFYRSGPGNPYGNAMGSLWLNATGQIIARPGINTEPVPDPFYFSWTHDTDIVAILSTLHLFRDSPTGKLPFSHIEEARNWKMSPVVPMGGRIVFEKLVCEMDTNQSSKGIFIRLNVNDGIVAIPGCATGPGLTCPLKAFLSMLDEKLAEAGDFAKTCGVDDSAPKHIEFLHQNSPKEQTPIKSESNATNP